LVTAAAVAPDGTWLATASTDGTARIWDAAGWHAQVMMRVDRSLVDCSWLGTEAVAVAGSAGLYLFSFLGSDTRAVL
jgi:WD40 repeat protein